MIRQMLVSEDKENFDLAVTILWAKGYSKERIEQFVNRVFKNYNQKNPSKYFSAFGSSQMGFKDEFERFQYGSAKDNYL